MYRGNRFTQATKSDRVPVAITLGVSLMLVVGIACGVRSGDKNKTGDSTVTTGQTTPTASPKPAVADNTIDSANGHIVPQNVTFGAAEAAFTKHHYAEATESFDSYVQRHPKNAYAHYMLGLSAWKSGDLERARIAFERSLELDSTNVKTLLNLGRVLLDQGNADDAWERVSTAVSLDTTSAEVRRMMGRVETARGERDSAITSYRVALSIDSADSWSMNNLGLLLIDEGRYSEALPPLARAVELRPEAPAFANNLGVALERTGHPVAAAEAYRAALKSDSTYAKAQVSLARVEGKTDDSTATPVDVTVLTKSFNDELQKAREQRVMAKVTVKPDSVQDPQR